MKKLLDVNVLAALTWPNHEFHSLCLSWFERHAREGWASCAQTEAGCVRVLCNPRVWAGAPPAQELAERLALNLSQPGHEFWSEELSFWDAVKLFRSRLHGYRQVTDAYLLGLAIHRRAQLVTLDRGIASLLPVGSPLTRHLVVVE